MNRWGQASSGRVLPNADSCVGSGHIRRAGDTSGPCAQGVGCGSDSYMGPFWIQH